MKLNSFRFIPILVCVLLFGGLAPVNGAAGLTYLSDLIKESSVIVYGRSKGRVSPSNPIRVRKTFKGKTKQKNIGVEWIQDEQIDPVLDGINNWVLFLKPDPNDEKKLISTRQNRSAFPVVNSEGKKEVIPYVLPVAMIVIDDPYLLQEMNFPDIQTSKSGIFLKDLHQKIINLTNNPDLESYR